MLINKWEDSTFKIEILFYVPQLLKFKQLDTKLIAKALCKQSFSESLN